jgi:hypothetical protein
MKENFSRTPAFKLLNPSVVNQPYYGDNLQVLREHIADEGSTGKQKELGV